MRSGAFKDRIDIINYSLTADGSGGFDPTYRIDKTVWANVRPLGGSRGLEGSQVEIELAYEIWLHYNDYIMLSKKNLIGFKERVFTIHSLVIVEERQTIFKLKVYESGANDVYLYNENLELITDENGDNITTNEGLINE